MTQREGFQMAGRTVAPGQRGTVHLLLADPGDQRPAVLTVHVVQGRCPGPVLFVSAAVHGDEVAGVEIVRRLLRAPQLDAIAGTLLAVPVVNSFGFLGRSRHLPDRSDLNRSFPGSASGTLASRLAHVFRTEILARSDHGIDLHSAAVRRENLPQVRVSPGDGPALALARAFAAPVTLTSRLRDGSLRAAARALGRTVILYEAGEALRVDEAAVRTGLAGILRVMAALGMIAEGAAPRAPAATRLCDDSVWLRAPAPGLLHLRAGLGETVAAGQVLARLSPLSGAGGIDLVSPQAGLILGRAHPARVRTGDALFHLAHLPHGAARACETPQLPRADRRA